MNLTLNDYNAFYMKYIKKETGHSILKDFLLRIERVNEDDSFIYNVEKIILFGSFLHGKEKPGDIDIAINFAAKERNADIYAKLAENQIRVAICNGCRFNNISQQITYPQEKVLRFLRGGHKSISFHFVGGEYSDFEKEIFIPNVFQIKLFSAVILILIIPYNL